MKIVMINHTFQQENFSKRWKLLAQKHHDWDVTLLAPEEWTWGDSKTLTFGVVETKKGYEVDEENYHVHTVKITKTPNFGWTSDEMIDYIRKNKPDIVYHIGSHTQESLMQILDYKRKECPNLKVYAFSMRGPVQDLSNIAALRKEDKSYVKKLLRYGQYAYYSNMVKKLNKYCDAIFCHYPDGMNSFRKEGYAGPVFMQTQVGVDTEVFYPDPEKREEIRRKYNVGDSFLFASAVRFQRGKGSLQVLDAMPLEGNWKYLLMGSGNPDEVEAIKAKIKERGLSEHVILPGFIEWKDMAAHWNAADCAIHFTQSTTKWVETFSLALVQAMATKLPVIGSNSGSVPYQIGPDGYIVDEKDIKGLHDKLQYIIDHQDEAKKVGDKLYRRTVNLFSTYHLNDLFYATVTDLLKGIYNHDYIDMANSKI